MLTTNAATTYSPATQEATDEVTMSESVEEITTPPEIKIESSTVELGTAVVSTTLVLTEEPTTSGPIEELTTQEIKTESSSTTSFLTTERVTEIPNFPDVAEETTTFTAIETGKHHHYKK